MFHNSLQTENSFGQVIFQPEVCKSFVTLFYHMSASPVPSSAYISSGGFNLAQQCFKWVQAEVLLVFDVLFLKQVLYMYYFLFRCGLKRSFQSPGRSGTPRNSICYVFYKEEWIEVFQACIQLDFLCTVPETSTILAPTQMWAWDQSLQSPGRKILLMSFLELYIVKFGFYSISSLQIVCEVSTVFIVAVSTWKWPEIKYPQPWDV